MTNPKNQGNFFITNIFMSEETLDNKSVQCIDSLAPPEEATWIFDQLDLVIRLQKE